MGIFDRVKNKHCSLKGSNDVHKIHVRDVWELVCRMRYCPQTPLLWSLPSKVLQERADVERNDQEKPKHISRFHKLHQVRVPTKSLKPNASASLVNCADIEAVWQWDDGKIWPQGASLAHPPKQSVWGWHLGIRTLSAPQTHTGGGLFPKWRITASTPAALRATWERFPKSNEGWQLKMHCSMCPLTSPLIVWEGEHGGPSFFK